MEKFKIGIFPFLILWGYAFIPSNSQSQNMVCEKPEARHGRKLNDPGPECDLSKKSWCTVKTDSYPEEILREYILDNRGIMKKLFGEVRQGRFFDEDISNAIYNEPYYPPPPLKTTRDKKQNGQRRNPYSLVNGRFPASDILANSRNEITTEGDENFTTKESEQVDESPKTNENKIEIKKESTTTKQTATISLDFGDELRYETKPSVMENPNNNNSFRPENVNEFDVKNSSKSSITTSADVTSSSVTTASTPSATTRLATSTSDLLKGRVEFRPSFSPSTETGNHRNQYVRPGYPSAQVYQGTPNANRINSPSEQSKQQVSPSATSNPSPSTPVHFERQEKFTPCNSTSTFISPTWAKNIQGKDLIVVNVGSFIQEVHIQECSKDVVHRKMFCRRGCRCEQEHSFQKLLVFDPGDECRGIFGDWFRFPSSCGCVCYRSQTKFRHARYMSEIYIDDEDYEDFLEDDLDDPAVRFYYGLDLLDKERVWDDLGSEEEDLVEDDEEQGQENVFWDETDRNTEGRDLEAAPSNRRVYQSFTDISSIDRQLGVSNANRDSLRSTWNAKDEHNNDKVLSILPNNHNNFTFTNAGREKKSRLLKGFNRTVNIRPQVAPRRIPPPRSSVRSYSFPWINSPNLSIWPSIAMYRKFNTYNKGPSGRSYSGEGIRPVTKTPLSGSTIGTLNAATPPYFDWKRKQIPSNEGSKDGSEKALPLSRIPRQVKIYV